MRRDDGPDGATGFGDDFWRANYGEPDQMDGVVNADAHAAYVKSAFDVALQPVRSIADLGFGLGHVFERVLRVLRPYKAYGLEPSTPAYEAVRFRLVPPEGTKLVLEQVDLRSWCRRPDHPKLRFDLGLCTSVLQYLPDREAARAITALAQLSRGLLYFSVLTAGDWKHNADTSRTDRGVHLRTADWYRRRLRRHFRHLGFGVHALRTHEPLLWELETP